MDIRDFRIGNSVLSNGKIVTIEQLWLNSIRHEQGENPYLDVKPIEINEQIILGLHFKCGECDYNNSFCRSYSREFDNCKLIYSIRFYSDKPTIEFVLEGNGGYDYPWEIDLTERLKYLHQLQNLWYDLTGEEIYVKKQKEQIKPNSTPLKSVKIKYIQRGNHE